MDYAKANAIRQVATICKAEMEATKNLQQRRSIIDRHLSTLRRNLDINKIDLQHAIYCLTYDK